MADGSTHQTWSASCLKDMIIYVRANDSISDIRYFEEYEEYVPLPSDRERLPSDFESVPKANENDCYDLCNED